MQRSGIILFLNPQIGDNICCIQHCTYRVGLVMQGLCNTSSSFFATSGQVAGIKRDSYSSYTADLMGNLLKRKWTEQEYRKFITAEYVVDD